MPTIKIDINTGIEHSPTDEIDSVVKLHNFTVGTDGSLYKLPILKNLKTVKFIPIGQDVDTGKNVVLASRILDIKKFQLTAVPTTAKLTSTYFINKSEEFSRFIYLTTGSYGVVNLNYLGSLLDEGAIPTDVKSKYGEFEYSVYQYKRDPADLMDEIDISSLNPSIVVDFNAQYATETDRNPTNPLRCVFPMQHMWKSRSESNYPLILRPRNVINCSMDATANNPDVKSLYVHDNSGTKREENDLARGCVPIGNRMVFYSALENAIFVSEQANFGELAQKGGSGSIALTTIPTEEIQSLTDFNGNLLTFSASGMSRWVISDVADFPLQKDPTFNHKHTLRYGGSFVKADRDLYFHTDDLKIYRLNSNLSIDPIFMGDLPIYKPLNKTETRETDLPMGYFTMLGYRFISIGPWLYNIESGTWSSYHYDGYKNPGTFEVPTEVAFENNTIAGAITAASDILICAHSSISRALTYKEMQDLPDTIEPTWVEDQYNFGEVAFFTTRMFQDEQTFSLDGVMVYVRGGMLQEGAKMWLKVLRGGELGDFDEEDESTYGVEATYSPVNADALGEDQSEHVGHFTWEGMNLKTDRFRLQLVTKEKRGIVIQSVFANITTPSDAQGFLVNNQQSKQQEQQ